jgi:hypothetical protein
MPGYLAPTYQGSFYHYQTDRNKYVKEILNLAIHFL